MSESQLFDWVDFYREFAQKLLPYENNRKELIEKLERVFDTEGITRPKLEVDDQLTDIDPFTIIGLFNKKLTPKNRLRLMETLRSEFQVEAPLPTSFGGIPLLNHQNATFYRFLGERDENDIDDLWKLFHSALALAKDDSKEKRTAFEEAFDSAINKRGGGNAKTTMGLFWGAPERFLNLDKNCRKYIEKSGQIPSNILEKKPNLDRKISGREYLAFLDLLIDFFASQRSQIHSFKELSEKAYRDRDLTDEVEESIRYWIYAPGEKANHWHEFQDNHIMGLGWDELGDFSKYESQSEMTEALQDAATGKSKAGGARMTWQFANVVKPGDVVFVKYGRSKIIGRGIVTGDYEWDPSRKHMKSIRKVNWTHSGDWTYPDPVLQQDCQLLPMKTLTDYTPRIGDIENLNTLLGITGEPEPAPAEAYDVDDFLSDVFTTREQYIELVNLILNKKNLIIQGAPGVGKTFIATRLAYAIMGVKAHDRIMSVQFHQSYSYEDFIMGFRPTSAGFELRRGAFYEFCKKAENDPEKDYFCIIDEINRGNLNKIFGELFMLLESDKRGISLQLLYANEKFSIPENVYVIGTMNTADRSLAMLDYALRRRFAFYEMKPGFDSTGFKTRMQQLNNSHFNELIKQVVELNRAIAEDETLGEGFCIGHSFFCKTDASEGALKSIVHTELIPLLKEYWFDEPANVKHWSERLLKAIS